MARVICFGELLLRLTAPGSERLLQSHALEVCVGGAEANVAVSLANFGHDVNFASVVADNPLGSAALGELRRHNVNTSAVLRAPQRMGLYFLEPGAVRRPSGITYDRAGSAFAEAAPDAIDWTEILPGADVFHVSGVTPAIGQKGADAAIRAVKAANAAAVPVSFDGNYRALLWQAWDGDGPAILREILSAATYAFINERDIALILKSRFESREGAFEAAFAAFPRLQAIACTTRQQSSVDDQAIAGELVTRVKRWVSPVHELPGVIDRIGGGDAFAAGALHGFITGRDEQYTIDFAVVAGALKHSIPGDFNRVSRSEVEAAMVGGSLDVRR
ncbi:sugar kinase [Hyphomonas sp.]|uniref:sugar kinase n=1 Tax=Hyphomonas sp. TaxID=87 RepID=UPI000AE4EBFE|nr:sugar kinase [Hyphomonas sp.]MBA4339716.1 2-keto-3-deoxygluconate kinase [Hyphomonas sp.]